MHLLGLSFRPWQFGKFLGRERHGHLRRDDFQDRLRRQRRERRRDKEDACIEAIRNLVPSNYMLENMWFAVRAALALEDGELLAAADILVGRAGSSWAVKCVAALVARAGADSRRENKAVREFLTAAELLPDGKDLSAAIEQLPKFLEEFNESLAA